MSPSPAGREASSGGSAPPYVRHRSERTLLYQLVEEYYPAFKVHLAAQGTDLPGYVQQEFEDYLKCGRLEHGFLRVRCDTCHTEHLVAFSCKKRGFCPSCGARRMAESAALLVDEVFPEQPVRQWVLSVPYPLRFLFASRPDVMGRVLGIVYRCISTHLIKKAGFSRKTAQAGAVTLGASAAVRKIYRYLAFTLDDFNNLLSSIKKTVRHDFCTSFGDFDAAAKKLLEVAKRKGVCCVQLFIEGVFCHSAFICGVCGPCRDRKRNIHWNGFFTKHRSR